jgi:uncharacterized protein YecE (DUF72 family)
MRIQIGTSGWQYQDWRGKVYPQGLPQDEWFRHITGLFPTVELNASFYRLPQRSLFARWRDQSPEGFRMAVKVSRYLTHIRRLREPAEPVERLWQRATALGDRLGPLLFQLPPDLPRNVDALTTLLACLPPRSEPVFEFRHASWHEPSVFRILDRNGAGLVWADRPGARLTLPITGDRAYLRFHRGGRDSIGYRGDKLRRWAARIAAIDARDTWVYFNNDQGGAAVRDADRLTTLLEDMGAPVARAHHERLPWASCPIR